MTTQRHDIKTIIIATAGTTIPTVVSTVKTQTTVVVSIAVAGSVAEAETDSEIAEVEDATQVEVAVAINFRSIHPKLFAMQQV